MNTIFEIIYIALKNLSAVTGFTYNEINIVVYYIVMPMIYFAMLDKIVNKHIFKIVFGCVVVVTIALVNFESFSNSLFDSSVNFLRWFEIFGWNYIVASVIICVIVPLIIFGVLFHFSYWPSVKNYLKNKHAKSIN